MANNTFPLQLDTPLVEEDELPFPVAACVCMQHSSPSRSHANLMINYGLFICWGNHGDSSHVGTLVESWATMEYVVQQSHVSHMTTHLTVASPLQLMSSTVLHLPATHTRHVINNPPSLSLPGPMTHHCISMTPPTFLPINSHSNQHRLEFVL